MTTTQHDGYTITEAPSVTLGKTTYKVSIQDIEGSNICGPTVWLEGPRGAKYFLRGYLGADNGLRQVISWKSGQPLRVKGNEVKVYHIGDVIEVAK